MTSVRFSAPLLVSAALACLVLACGPVQKDCNPSECAGCCDSKGVCQAGLTQDACGFSGSACNVCSVTQFCSGGACLNFATGNADSGTPGNDGGNNGDGGDEDGGNGDGGVCDSSNCNGCCDFNGACLPGTDQNACGASGASCQTCSGLEACNGDVCLPIGTDGGFDGGFDAGFDAGFDGGFDGGVTDAGSLPGDTCATVQFLTLSPTGTPGLNQVAVTGSITGYGNAGAGSCGGSGPDRVYAITTSKTLHLQAFASGGTYQPVLYLRSACASGERQCAGPGGFLDDAALPAGTWYLWVDGPAGSSGSFTLDVYTYEAPKAGDVCSDAQPLSFSGGFASFTGDTSGYADDVNTTATGCTSLTGGDQFFTFNNPSLQNFTVTVTPQSGAYRPAVYLRNTCTGSTVSCATATSNGAAVTLSYTSLPSGNWILVVDGASGTSGPYSLSAQLAPASGGTGDTCSSPIPLSFSGTTTRTASATGTTATATHAMTSACSVAGATAKDRVYSFTTTTTTNLTATVTPNPGWDVGISLRGAPCTSGSEIVCLDASGSGAETINQTNLPPGSYFIWIDGYGTGDSGAYSLSVQLVEQATADGNTCSSPIPLVLSGTTTQTASATGTTVGATNNNAPTCASSSGSGPDRVYVFTTTATKNLTATVTPSPAWDVGISLRGSSCTGTQLACTDASGSAAETITYTSLPAGTHYLWIDGYTSTSSGAYSLSLTLQ